MLDNASETVSHGRLQCRACWSGCSGNHQLLDGGKSQLVNDPGYWGASDPAVVVLGITKGFTQSNLMSANPRKFDSVAFAKFRPRLLQGLQAVGLMTGTRDINEKFTASERDYGFASLVRCSLTAFDGTKFVSSGDAVTGAMKKLDGARVFNTCVHTYLPLLTARTKLVVLLGNKDSYIEQTNEFFSRIFPDYQAHPHFKGLVFRANNRFIVHIGHPSPANGKFGKFIKGERAEKQGEKCLIVRHAVAQILPQGSTL